MLQAMADQAEPPPPAQPLGPVEQQQQQEQQEQQLAPPNPAARQAAPPLPPGPPAAPRPVRQQPEQRDGQLIGDGHRNREAAQPVHAPQPPPLQEQQQQTPPAPQQVSSSAGPAARPTVVVPADGVAALLDTAATASARAPAVADPPAPDALQPPPSPTVVDGTRRHPQATYRLTRPPQQCMTLPLPGLLLPRTCTHCRRQRQFSRAGSKAAAGAPAWGRACQHRQPWRQSQRGRSRARGECPACQLRRCQEGVKGQHWGVENRGATGCRTPATPELGTACCQTPFSVAGSSTSRPKGQVGPLLRDASAVLTAADLCPIMVSILLRVAGLMCSIGSLQGTCGGSCWGRSSSSSSWRRRQRSLAGLRLVRGLASTAGCTHRQLWHTSSLTWLSSASACMQNLWRGEP